MLILGRDIDLALQRQYMRADLRIAIARTDRHVAMGRANRCREWTSRRSSPAPVPCHDSQATVPVTYANGAIFRTNR